MDKEAISLIQNTAIAATKTLKEENGVILVPNNTALQDIEKYLPAPRRKRGVFSTDSIGSFAEYVDLHAVSDSSYVFIDQHSMSANAIFDFGTMELPGHCDHRSVITLKKTPAYDAIMSVAETGKVLVSQQSMIDFLLDWKGCIDMEKEKMVDFIAAVRRVTIKTTNDTAHTEQRHLSQRTELEQIAASAAKPLPESFEFKCVPYLGLTERCFTVTTEIRTSKGPDNPMFRLKIVSLDQAREDMAEEFSSEIHDSINKEIHIHFGEYEKS